MFRRQQKKSIVLVLSLCLLVTPALQAQNEMPANQRMETVTDVALSAQGMLEGRLVDGTGKVLDGAPITVWQGQQLIGKGTTDKDGGFRMAGLASGVYRFDAPGSSVTCRVWSASVAPPSARNSLLMVGGDPAVRGQYGMLDPVTTTALLLGVAGVTLSAITLARVNDLNDKVDTLTSP